MLNVGDVVVAINGCSVRGMNSKAAGAYCTVLFFDSLRSRSAIEFHAFAPLEASMHVTNGISLGWSAPLTGCH